MQLKGHVRAADPGGPATGMVGTQPPGAPSSSSALVCAAAASAPQRASVSTAGPVLFGPSRAWSREAVVGDEVLVLQAGGQYEGSSAILDSVSQSACTVTIRRGYFGAGTTLQIAPSHLMLSKRKGNNGVGKGSGGRNPG